MANEAQAEREVASVFVESDDGGYSRGFCRFSDLFSSDLAASKGRRVLVDVYSSPSLAANTRTSVDASAVFRANNDDTNGTADMTSLTYLEEPNMLQCLQSRYDKDNIYTNIAGVLVAVNPYHPLGIYSLEHMALYRGQRRLDLLPPHVFAVAEKAYQELRSKHENQSMICCGESGSGKTESTKMLMRYLANVTVVGHGADESAASATSLIERQVLQANPLLEAFGNAKTLMNENSSRFAKFTKLFVSNEEGRIMGAYTETYLLEKSRVVHPNKGERNFHIFYQLAAGLGAEWKLLPASEFHYLNAGNCTVLSGVSDADNFAAMRDSMSLLNISPEEQEVAFSVIVGIMYMGNVFIDKVAGKPADQKEPFACRLSDQAAALVQRAADLIGCDSAGFRKRLLTRRIKVSAKEEYEITLEPEEFVINRDAMAKSLYSALFLWVVRRVNDALYRGEVDTVNWIGLLDVFGFECFESNSFEQFCINFANEKLQEFFNGHILKSEQAEYRREGIFWTPINIPDNTDCISLISSKPSGILCLLDSACIMPKGGPDTFHNNLFAVHGSHARLMATSAKSAPAAKQSANPARFAEQKKQHDKSVKQNAASNSSRGLGFFIKHYAGFVCYDATHFLTKNSDSTHADTVELFFASKHALVRSLFQDEAEQLATSQQGNRFQSVGSTFGRQLNDLMSALQQTTPYFIRCASPNGSQASYKFIWNYVKPQLRCGGLVEALRMLKFGYPSRVKYDAISEKYAHALKPVPVNLNFRNFCEAILVAFGLGRSQYQLGLTKVFFRPGQQGFLEAIFRRSEEPLTPEMDAQIRKWLVKRRIQRATSSVKTFLWCEKRLQHIRSARWFRRAVRIGIIYLQSLRATLNRIRRLGRARRNAITTIQRSWRHTVRRRALTRFVGTRIKNKRKDRFKMVGLDAKSAEELNVLRVQMQSLKKKEEAEKKRLEELEKEARAKELLMQKAMDERKLEVERMQREMEALKQRDVEAAQQAEQIQELKARTARMREESERAAATARMIVKEREAEAVRKQQELEKLRIESERKAKEHEEAQKELLRQKEEERLKRESDLAKMQEQTEKLRAEHEAKVRDGQRLLQEREEMNRKKEEELAKMREQAERLKQEHVQETVELQQQREAERRIKEEDQRKLQLEIERMRLEVEAEQASYQNELRSREEVNKRKERELMAMKLEAERVRVEQEQAIAQLNQQRQLERQKKQEELQALQRELVDAQKFYEDQAREQARLLLEKEAENKRKEEVLARLAAEAALEREQHVAKAAEAERQLREQEAAAKAEAERLRQEREDAARQHQLRAQQLQEEAKAELEAQLKKRDAEAQSAADQMKSEHEATVKQLSLHIISLEQEIDRLGDEADSTQKQHNSELAQLHSQLRASQAETKNRDETITSMKAEMERMRQAADQLREISERLLSEAQEEHKRRTAEYSLTVSRMKESAEKQADELSKLQRDYHDVVAHFQAEMQQVTELKSLAAGDRRRTKGGHAAADAPPGNDRQTSVISANKMRVELSRSRLISQVEVRPDFSSLLSASITAQKTAKDFISSFKIKSGWLMKRRPGNVLLGKGAKMRYMVLDGGSVLWFNDAKEFHAHAKPKGSLELKDYELLASEKPEEKDSELTLHLIPRDHSKSKEEMILSAPSAKDSQGAPENIQEWMQEVNKRIAVMAYLDVVFNQDKRGKGCRELLEFVTDGTIQVLVIENKVVDLHTGLMMLQETLKFRKGFKKIVLNNIALTDPSVEILSNILIANSEIEHLELMHNLVTLKGAQFLAKALAKNTSLRSLALDYNSLGDNGLTALVSSLPLHKSLYRISCTGNKISDQGTSALAEELIKSGPEHAFPQLELAENLIGDIGCAAIAHLCEVNPSISKLNLRSNLVSDAGIIRLAAALRTGKCGLHDIRLSNNQVSNKGLIALSDAMKATNQDISVDLSHNKLISRSGVAPLITAEFPLEFSLLKVVRRREDPIIEAARLAREREREAQQQLIAEAQLGRSTRQSMWNRN